MRPKIHIAAVALLSAAIATAAAPARTADTYPHPADPTADVPVSDYQSVFAGYRKAAFDEKLDWKQANDAVRDVGGHAGAMKDMPHERRQDMIPHSGHGRSPMGHGGHK